MTTRTATPEQVQEFLALSADTQALMRGCASLLHGADGPSQPTLVRPLLTKLEARDLATYSEARGWRLTDAGQIAAHAYLAIGRAARKAAAS